MQVMRAHRVVPVLAILALCAGSASAVQAQDAVKGQAVLADARKAIGGEDRLRAVKTLQATGTFRRSAGNNSLEGDVEILIEVPDKLRRNESTGFAGGFSLHPAPIRARLENRSVITRG